MDNFQATKANNNNKKEGKLENKQSSIKLQQEDK